MQILYKIYSRDVEMENTKCILVMQKYSEEDQFSPLATLNLSLFWVETNYTVSYCVCFGTTTTKYTINNSVWIS